MDLFSITPGATKASATPPSQTGQLGVQDERRLNEELQSAV